jgi:hypothetical protein
MKLVRLLSAINWEIVKAFWLFLLNDLNNYAKEEYKPFLAMSRDESAWQGMFSRRTSNTNSRQ